MNLMLTDRSVNISGEYYTVSNGFVTVAGGAVRLPYKDLLAVEIIKARSKKAMYALFSLCGLFLLALDFDIVVSAVIVIVVAAILGVALAAYYFSARYFVEITSMRGTFRVPIERGDTEAQKIAEQLQARMYAQNR